jgi:hypothetical protein
MGKHRHGMIGAEAATATVKSPALPFTYEEPTAGAFECHGTAQALAAELANARLGLFYGFDAQAGGKGAGRG